MGARSDRPDYDHADGVTLHVHAWNRVVHAPSTSAVLAGTTRVDVTLQT